MSVTNNAPIVPPSRGLVSLLLVVGTVVCGIIYFRRDVPWDLTATTTVAPVTAWVLTPDAAPGGAVQVELGLRAGERAGLGRILCSNGQTRTSHFGDGNTWGKAITSGRLPTTGLDTTSFELKLPASATPGERGEFLCLVETIVAEAVYFPRKGFRNTTKIVNVTVAVTARSTAALVFWRFVTAGRAVVVALFAMGLFTLGWSQLRRFAHSNDAQGIALCGFAWIFVYAYLGYHVFARSLAGALGLNSPIVTVPALALWVIAPPLGARAIDAWRRSRVIATLRLLAVGQEGPYRQSPAESSAPGAPAEDAATRAQTLARALEGEGYAVRRLGRTLKWQAEGQVVRLRVGRNGDLAMRAGALEPLVAAARALAVQLGPLELRLPGASLLVDGQKNTRELLSELALPPPASA